MACVNFHLPTQHSLSLHDLGLIIYQQNPTKVVLASSCNFNVNKPPPTYQQDSSIEVYDNCDSIFKMIKGHLELNYITDITPYVGNIITFRVQSKASDSNAWWARMHCFGADEKVRHLLLPPNKYKF